MLKDKEIEEIAKPFLEKACDLEYGEQMTCVEEFGLFAREIEAKVRAELVPKFKVGDIVHIHGSTIPREVLDVETRPTYRLSDISSRWTQGTLELVEEAR